MTASALDPTKNPGSWITLIDMKKLFSTLVLILLFVLPLRAAESSADAVKNLEAAIKKEIEGRPRPNDTETQSYYRGRDPGRGLLGQIELTIASGETSRVEEMLAQLPTYFTSDEVRQQILKVSAAIKQERDAKENAYVSELNAALKRASDALHAAKSTEDLDEPQKNLSAFRNQDGSGRISDAARLALRKVETTLNFLRYWQDYLAAQKTGNTVRARQSLQELTNQDSSDLMPRSQLIAELQRYPTEQETKIEAPRPEQIDEIVAKVKTLDRLGDAINVLRKIQTRLSVYSSSAARLSQREIRINLVRHAGAKSCIET
jgi:hypothetical protein